MRRSISELSDLLAQNAEGVAMMLLPGGKRVNGHWVAGDVNGGEGKCLQVNLEGQFVGKWRDWADSQEYRGDLVDLWRVTRNLGPKETLKEVKSHLGIHDPVEPQSTKTYSAPKDNPKSSPDGVIYKYLTEERKLESKIVGQFDIRGARVKGDVYISFPSFSPSGEIVNNSYRSLEPIDNGKKKVFQDKGCAPSLFGWQAMTEADYRGRKILLCEGQIDAMTWRQWGIPALSIPNGSGTTWIEYEWENLEMFDTIYLSFDMDGKTQDSLKKTISRLGRHRCLIVNIPDKDANDALKAGRTSEEAQMWVRHATAPKLKDFVNSKDLRDRIYKQFYPDPEDRGIKIALLTGRSKEQSFEVRPGEVSIWTGISGHGKSTFLKDVFMDLIHNDQKCMIASFEMKPEKIVKTMFKSAFGREILTPSEIDAALEQVGSQIFFCDRIGSISPKELLEMMEFAHCRHGVTQFMIDSLMRVDGLEEDYPAQGDFMNKLSSFVKDFPSHVHIVCHPRKTSEDATPSGNDIKGSTLLRANCDNIFSVSRNFKKERAKAEGKEVDEDEDGPEWDARVTVEKDREEGDFKVFHYRYLKTYNRYLLLK
jgi:twinkle protein